MEGKKSFILYTDIIHTVSKLPDEKAGQLFKHILEYVNDKNPETNDLIIQISFEPIKQALKRNLKEWELTKENKSKGGIIGNLKRWHPDLYTKLTNKELNLDECISIASDRKLSHTDTMGSETDTVQSQTIASIAVSVSDSVIDINNTLMSEIFISDDNDKKNLIPKVEIPEKDKQPALIAYQFWNLIKSNLERNGISIVKHEKAVYKNWVPAIRLIIENKEATIDQLREIHHFLKTDLFWQKNILSTEKLRKQVQQLLLTIKNNSNGEPGTGSDGKEKSQNNAHRINTKESAREKRRQETTKSHFSTPDD
jgi:hypothetical protein